MTVSVNTIQAGGLGDFCKNLGEKDLLYQKRWQKRFRKSLKSSGKWSKRWYCICISKPYSSFIIVTRGF